MRLSFQSQKTADQDFHKGNIASYERKLLKVYCSKIFFFLRHTVRFQMLIVNSHGGHKTILSDPVFVSVGFFKHANTKQKKLMLPGSLIFCKHLSVPLANQSVYLSYGCTGRSLPAVLRCTQR